MSLYELRKAIKKAKLKRFMHRLPFFFFPFLFFLFFLLFLLFLHGFSPPLLP